MITSDESVKDKIVAFCNGRNPIKFILEGIGDFDKIVDYVPVADCHELLKFDSGLENLLSGEVKFAKKLNKDKILHATIYPDEEFSTHPKKIEQYMLRLTAMKKDRIWFSYDFVDQEILDRGQSLDKSSWYGAVHRFSKKYILLPTRQGYMKISNKNL